MRIIWVLLIWIVFIGGLTTYMLQRNTALSSNSGLITIESAQGDYTLTLTTTFSAQPDPFALTVSGDPPPALSVRMGSRILLQMTEGIQPGQPIRVPIEEGLVQGANEILIKASPSDDAGGQAQAVRVQIYRDQLPLAEQTYWSTPGGNIAETFRFEIASQPEDRDHDH